MTTGGSPKVWFDRFRTAVVSSRGAASVIAPESNSYRFLRCPFQEQRTEERVDLRRRRRCRASLQNPIAPRRAVTDYLFMRGNRKGETKSMGVARPCGNGSKLTLHTSLARFTRFYSRKPFSSDSGVSDTGNMTTSQAIAGLSDFPPVVDD